MAYYNNETVFICGLLNQALSKTHITLNSVTIGE
jgi:hypothetical protein